MSTARAQSSALYGVCESNMEYSCGGQFAVLYCLLHREILIEPAVAYSLVAVQAPRVHGDRESTPIN